MDDISSTHNTTNIVVRIVIREVVIQLFKVQNTKKATFLENFLIFGMIKYCKFENLYMIFISQFLARLHEVHRAIAVTPVVHVPVPVPVPVRVPVRVRVRVTLALKFSRSPYLDNHSSESIHTWTIDTL